MIDHSYPQDEVAWLAATCWNKAIEMRDLGLDPAGWAAVAVQLSSFLSGLLAETIRNGYPELMKDTSFSK